MPVRAYLWLVLTLIPVHGCGGGDDGTADALVDTRVIGPETQLPILEGYNHASETSIAVHDGRVVIAFINQALVAADSFE